MAQLNRIAQFAMDRPVYDEQCTPWDTVIVILNYEEFFLGVQSKGR